MAANLVAYLRETVGLPMTSAYANGYRLCWTGDGDKADIARDAGARVVFVKSRDGRSDGWEITAHVDREVTGGGPS
jgi:hypothetical protein